MSNTAIAKQMERNDLPMVRKMHSQIVGEVKSSHNRVENNIRGMFNDLKREWQKIQKENLDLRSKNQQLQQINNNLTKTIAILENERIMTFECHAIEVDLYRSISYMKESKK